MGKIILTERQYRNLNQILIGKEVENNKGRLNEMNEDKRLDAESVGKQIKFTLKQCAEPQGRESGNWCINKMMGLLKQLKTHEQFDEATKFTGYLYTDIGYGVDRSWTQNLGSFLKMLNGTNGGDGTPVDKINAASLFASYFALAGGTLSYGKSTNSTGAIILTPMSFTLSWKTPAAAPATAAPATPATPATPGTFSKEMPLNYSSDAGVSWTPTQIFVFQQWYWNEKEINQTLISGTEGDPCTAKYASALCGGKACIAPKACDGKLGSNTKSLITDSNIDEFIKWLNANRTKANEYLLPFKTCSSADKGYVSSAGSQTGGRSNTGRRSSAGGGGGSTGGGGTGAHELSGLV